MAMELSVHGQTPVLIELDVAGAGGYGGMEAMVVLDVSSFGAGTYNLSFDVNTD
jgi:hypothetical protein